jgi:very-short-patch-repair endonuclease
MSSKTYTKKEYILKQFARTNKKNYENYVVTRIFHLLDDLDIKFVTQQYFKKSKGSFGLSDMYFPQFNLSIEIDEGQHENERNISKDKIRDIDYISATEKLLQHSKKWMPYRIKVAGEITIQQIDKSIDNVVSYIKKLKKKINNFQEWDIEKEFDYAGKDVFDINEQIVFRRIVDSINYFRTNENKYKGYQRAGALTMDKQKKLWFPKLYPNNDWNNTLINNEMIIKEIPVENTKWDKKNHLQYILQKNDRKRIVFAKVKGNLGFILYRFKGYYVLNEKKSKQKGFCIWERKATKVSIPDGNPIF